MFNLCIVPDTTRLGRDRAMRRESYSPPTMLSIGYIKKVGFTRTIFNVAFDYQDDISDHRPVLKEAHCVTNLPLAEIKPRRRVVASV